MASNIFPHPYEETLNDINNFLRDIEKDVKLAKQFRSTMIRAEKLMNNWADRRNGMEFCLMPGCMNTRSEYDNYCIPCERKLARQELND